MDAVYISRFQRLFDNMSECYKLFWFKAILDAVFNGATELNYEEIINRMICDAWYMVQEYRLNLGPKDYLEIIVKRLGELSGYPSNEKPDKILSFLAMNRDPEILEIKRILIQNVPYRLQAPFLPSRGEFNWQRNAKRVAEDINGYDGLIYSFISIDGLKSVIQINRNWAEYFIENYEVLNGWVEFNMINYL